MGSDELTMAISQIVQYQLYILWWWSILWCLIFVCVLYIFSCDFITSITMYVIMPDQVRTYSAHVCTYDHKNNQSNNTNWLRAFALSQIIHALVSTSTHHSQDNWTSVLYVLTGVETQVRATIGGVKSARRKNAYSVAPHKRLWVGESSRQTNGYTHYA